MLGHSQYISTLYSTVLLVNSTTGEARTVQFVNMLILCSMPMPKNLHSSTELALCSPYYFQCAVDYLMWYAEAATFVPWQLTVQETASHEVPSDLNWVFSFKAIEAVFKACCTVYWTNAYHRDTATQATTSLSPFFTLYTRKPPHTMNTILQYCPDHSKWTLIVDVAKHSGQCPELAWS